MCLGERIGDEFDDVTCVLTNAQGDQRTLDREKRGKFSYNARLPETLLPGQYTVQMCVEGGELRSQGLHLELLSYGSPPRVANATPVHPSQSGGAMETEDFHSADILDLVWDSLDRELAQHGSNMLRQESFSSCSSSSVFHSVSDSDTFLRDREQSELEDWLSPEDYAWRP